MRLLTDRFRLITALLVTLEIVSLFVIHFDLHSVRHAVKPLAGRALRTKERRLTIDLGNGDCIWTDASSFDGTLGNDDPISRTLFAAYPGSGARFAWKASEGLAGITTTDDWEFTAKDALTSPLLKTQYPHNEGIWSYGSNISQAILLIRSPLLAIPSYHATLFEIHYAYDYKTAYKYILDLYSRRSDPENWKKFRDLRFAEEIHMWCSFIDYWMEGGTKYWQDGDVARDGKNPFRFLTESEMYDETGSPNNTDLHCDNTDGTFDCVAKAVLCYERLVNTTSGLSEVNKLANALSGTGLNVIAQPARQCVYDHLINNIPERLVDENDLESIARSDYALRYGQLEEMADTLQKMKDKYSSGKWENNVNAHDLVTAFDIYLIEVATEMVLTDASAPTPAPGGEYYRDVDTWWDTVGEGHLPTMIEMYHRVREIAGLESRKTLEYNSSHTFTHA